MAENESTEIFKKERDALVEVVKSAIKPGSDEFGQFLADKVRMFRVKSAIKGMQKAKILCEESGTQIDPTLKFMVPWLEGVSLEEHDAADSENVFDMWASILAKQDGDTHPLDYSAIACLKSMSPSTAEFFSKNAELLSYGSRSERSEMVGMIFINTQRAFKEISENSQDDKYSFVGGPGRIPIFETIFQTLRNSSAYVSRVEFYHKNGNATTSGNLKNDFHIALSALGIVKIDSVDMDISELLRNDRLRSNSIGSSKFAKHLISEGAINMRVEYIQTTDLGVHLKNRCLSNS